MIESNLPLVPTKVLIDELLSRCDVAIVAFCKESVKGEDDMEMSYYYHGNALQCLGLCTTVSNYIYDDQESEDMDDDKET